MNAPYAAQHALHMTKDQHAVLHIVYILLVPQKLALATPMPEQEERAQRTLAELEEMARRVRVKVEKRVERCRDLARGIVTVAEQERASQLILGVTPGDLAAANGFLTTVLQKAPCEVMVVRAPATAEQAV
jgi:nucleotide-binding universal stress UspA family protein